MDGSRGKQAVQGTTERLLRSNRECKTVLFPFLEEEWDLLRRLLASERALHSTFHASLLLAHVLFSGLPWQLRMATL